MMPDSRRCHYFFLYDGSKVRGEGDPTRDGICYFYPEETPVDQQELLCGQLAGVGRCVSELSSSPVRVLRLRRSKFAIRVKDDFFWALGCSVDVPTLSVCDLLDQLINLFCFYNGSVRQSYQFNSRESLAARWAHYLSHLQTKPSELHHIFSCLRTVDTKNIDPLLLLKAALILQACQRCPLVLAGCILFCGRVVSTQMSPDLTLKVMVHETESYNKEAVGRSAPICLCSTVSSTTVFLTSEQLHELRSALVNKESQSSPNKDRFPKKSRPSRTLSNTPSTGSDSSDPDSSHSPPTAHKDSCSPHPSEDSAFSLVPSGRTDAAPQSVLPNRKNSHDAEEDAPDDSYYCSFHSDDGGSSLMLAEGDAQPDGGAGDAACGTMIFDNRRSECGSEESRSDVGGAGSGSQQAEMGDARPRSAPATRPAEGPLIPMTLYLHRVESLVLALLVEPHFLSDAAAMEDVYHSSLASLNGLEAHLRSIAAGAPQGSQGPYIFAHFDCVQNTLTFSQFSLFCYVTNLSARPVGALERSFVRATSLLHSHFFNSQTLQEAIIRSAGAAVYGTRSLAQETYFLQHGGTARNSGRDPQFGSGNLLPAARRDSEELRHPKPPGQRLLPAQQSPTPTAETRG
ncbi:hypothetical protein LDENG_00066430 [Lucifuga dentata]|nr:hypothetical protein LDENG_00066430 [Lucifuga dentata]